MKNKKYKVEIKVLELKEGGFIIVLTHRKKTLDALLFKKKPTKAILTKWVSRIRSQLKNE